MIVRVISGFATLPNTASTAGFWCGLRSKDAANWGRWPTNGRFTAIHRNRNGNRSVGDKDSFNNTMRESYA